MNDTITYNPKFGAKVLMNWFFAGQQQLFKEIYLDKISKKENEVNEIIKKVYIEIRKEFPDFNSYELKEHQGAYSDLSYQDVVLNMKKAFKIQTNIFIDILLNNKVDEKFIALLKSLHFCTHMSTKSSSIYYAAMKEKYLKFIQYNNINIDFIEFNNLKDIYFENAKFLMNDGYYYACEEEQLFDI